MVNDNYSDKSGDNDNDDKLIMTMTPGSAIAGFNFISNWLSGRPTVKEEQEMETIFHRCMWLYKKILSSYHILFASIILPT